MTVVGEEKAVRSAELAEFERNGYLIRDDGVSPAELDLLRLQADELHETTRQLRLTDGNGRSAKLNFISRVIEDSPDSPIAKLANSPVAAGFARSVVGEIVEMLYITLSYKGANDVGFGWHQDFRLWYDLGCLYPRLITVFVALDDMSVENGCLSVIEGSHQAGRLDHKTDGGQEVVEPRMLELLLDEHPTRLLECRAGSVVYMHCNLVHSSGLNTSSRGVRRALILNINSSSARPRLEDRYSPILLH